MNEPFLVGFEAFRVRVCEGEERTARKRRKRERNAPKNERSGPLAFYVLSEPGRVKTDPLSFTYGLWMRIQWIRTNPTSLRRSEDPDPPALGWINVFWAFGSFLLSFLSCLLVAPTFLLSEPMCMPDFLQKIQENFLCILDVFLAV